MSTPLDSGVVDLSDAEAAQSLLGRLPAGAMRPFDDRIVAFFGDLSEQLVGSRDLARTFPDATAFGYWLRRSNIERLRRRLIGLEELQGGVRVPRGVSFHVAPGNVEALFAYSWATAALCGNTGVVKVSSRGSGLSSAVTAVIREAIGRHPGLEDRWNFVSYPRERGDVTRTLVAAADLLVFWGGDQTVTELRQLPAQPHAKVVGFPDRESLLVLRTAHYRELDSVRRDEVAERFANDVFSFGQAACSSPRYVVWVGDAPGRLAGDLYGRVASHSERLADITPTEVMNKRTFLYELAASGGVDTVVWEQPQWLVVGTDRETVRTVEHPALGTLVEAHCTDLDQVTGLLRPADQTVIHVGFEPDELESWVRRSGGPWPKRFRPVGQAIDFDARWDGMDLLSEFTSLTTVD